MLVERDQYVGIAAAYGSRIAIGQVDAGDGQPDVVHDACNLVLGNHLAQRRLNVIHQARGIFHTQPGWGAHVQLDLTGVHLREEITPEKWNQQHRSEGHTGEYGHEDTAMMQDGRQH